MALLVEPHVHQWTRSEYYKMAEAGLFDGKHVEFIEGQVVEMSPMGSSHRTAVLRTGDRLRQVLRQGYFVSTQCPLDLGEIFEPEPDVAMIAEYWIVNLVNRQLEVRRNPRVDAMQRYGFGYAEVTIYAATDVVAPLAMPQTTVSVEDVLP